MDTKNFFGYGKLQIILYPFDNIMQFVIATGTAQSPTYMDLSRFSQHKLTFKTDQTSQSFDIFTEANDDLTIGNITFKVPQSKYAEIKKIYNQNVNVFYITGISQGTTSVIYTGLFKVYDNTNTVAELNQQATGGITLDTTLPKETAIVTRKPIKEMLPTLKPSNMKNNGLLGKIGNQIGNVITNLQNQNDQNQTPSIYTEYVTQSQQTAKSLANAIGMPLNDFANINGIQPGDTVKAKTVVKVPNNLAFKTAFLVPKK